MKTLLTLSRCLSFAIAALLAAQAWGAADSGAALIPVVDEFFITRGTERIAVRVQSSPRERLAAHPLLLLNLSMDRASSLAGGKYGEPARIFLEAGHRVASFDLPAHGERVDRHGSSIAGLCNRVVAGMHPFDDFVAEGKLALDALLERKWGVPGEVVVCGVSRAGYCALRLAAADPRVAGVAAFAPVTDWGELREFAAVREDPKVTALKLVNFVTGLAGRRIYIAIGSADDRVSTVACTQVTLALLQAEAAAGLKRSQLRFVIADDTVGHALANRCRVEGVQFLLKGGSVSGSSSLP